MMPPENICRRPNLEDVHPETIIPPNCRGGKLSGQNLFRKHRQHRNACCICLHLCYFSGQMWATHKPPSCVATSKISEYPPLVSITFVLTGFMISTWTKPFTPSLSCYQIKRLSPLPTNNLQSQKIHIHKRRGRITS